MAMTPRPSLAACSNLLLGTPGQFQLMAATNGGDASTRGLFKRALGDDISSQWKYFSCDSVGIAKPDPRVYDAIWANFDNCQRGKGWFIASHTWYVELVTPLFRLLLFLSVLLVAGQWVDICGQLMGANGDIRYWTGICLRPKRRASRRHGSRTKSLSPSTTCTDTLM